MDSLSIGEAKLARPDGWRSILAVRNNGGFFALLSSLEEKDSSIIGTPTETSSSDEFTPTMGCLRTRIRSNENDIQYDVSGELLADLKSRYNPEHMDFDDLQQLLDELIENGVISEDEKENLLTVPVFLGVLDSEYSGDMGLAASGDLLDTINQNIEAMGKQLAWTQTKGFAVMNGNSDPLQVAVNTADWLNRQMTLQNFLKQLN